MSRQGVLAEGAGFELSARTVVERRGRRTPLWSAPPLGPDG
jgi:hypothetical protein